ncbi:MAG TPA: hypothetical protein VHO67_04710 [Polyangia bacterium]|nr:hypothetical protein [Polyangia bacterium]
MAATDSDRAKQEFLARFGHAHDDHNPEDVPNAFRRLIFNGSACGWWWCGASLARSQWTNLLKALEVLEAHNLNPKGLDILTVASQVRAANQLGPQREALNRFDKVARELLAALWPNGPTEVLKKAQAIEAVVDGQRRLAVVPVKDDPFTLLTATISAFEPLVRAANAARPHGQDPRVNNGRRAALAKGVEISRSGGRPGQKPRRWTTDTVAAALILTGVDSDDLSKLTTNLAKMRNRKTQVGGRRSTKSS